MEKSGGIGTARGRVELTMGFAPRGFMDGDAFGMHSRRSLPALRMRPRLMAMRKFFTGAGAAHPLYSRVAGAILRSLISERGSRVKLSYCRAFIFLY